MTAIQEPDEPEDIFDRADGANVAAVEAVYQTLRTAILRCEIPPNAVLSQVQLAKRFGVSRTPLREVLRMLERERLVESKHNRRVRISGFSVEDLEEVFATRVMLESLAARSRMRTMSLTAITQMETSLEAMGEASSADVYEAWAMAHRRFHRVLTVETDTRTAETLSQLADHADRYRGIFAEHAQLSWSVGIRQHKHILDAVRRFEPDAVARLVAMHVGRAGQTFIDATYPGYQSTRIEDAMALILGENSRLHETSNPDRDP